MMESNLNNSIQRGISTIQIVNPYNNAMVNANYQNNSLLTSGVSPNQLQSSPHSTVVKFQPIPVPIHIGYQDQPSHQTVVSSMPSNILQPQQTISTQQQRSSLRKVGNIEYDFDQILGGSDKTYVYKGMLQELVLGHTVGKRDVAVKKIICGGKEDCQMNLKEVEILFSCNDHENIVKYFLTETDRDYNVYIAMELCLGTLQHWMENKIVEIQPGHISAIEILQQTTKAVAYLHAKAGAIIHRDLKPENILLQNVYGKVCVKVADFGTSRILPNERTSMTIKTNSGTKGWKSPEILNAQSPSTMVRYGMSRATDIFSLGCLFCYVLSGGKHPFDQPGNHNPELRDYNILHNKRNINEADFSPRIRGYITLFKQMIDMIPLNRPTANEILSYPLFWGYEKELSFLFRVSNVLQENPKSDVVQQCKSTINQQHSSFINNNIVLQPGLNTNGKVVTGWQTMMCENLIKYFMYNSPRSYDGSSTEDLIRAIRNLYSHYDNLPPFVKASLGPPPGEFMLYWDNGFPFLVPVVWNVCKVLLMCTGFEWIKTYYEI